MGSESWLSMTRRRLFGHVLVGGGAFLASCGLADAGQRTAQRGRLLLDRMPSIPDGLRDAISFPLVEALLGRRSRRFALGCSIPDGPFAYTSTKKPLPLSELEETLLLTAVAGNTGWQYLIPHDPNYLPNIPNYSAAAGGRTFPSAAGFHTTEFFFTNDDGVYFLPTRDSGSLKEQSSDGSMNLHDYLQAHRKRIRKLSDSRLNLPRTEPHMEMHNAWCANQPGTTLIIPVTDAAQHHLANLCYLVQNGVCIFDDFCDAPIPGLEKFRSIVDVDHPYPLSLTEQMTFSEVTIEASTACYAGALMQQALGLGGWAYGGLNPFSVLGASGDPEVPGLGFRFETDDRWPLPNVTGLPGVFDGYCPPLYKTMRDAVEALVERKFGEGGPYNRDTDGPYRNNGPLRASGERHDDQFIDCVATMAQYIFDRYGRCPATFSSVFTTMYLQAHHLDCDYYDELFCPDAYLRTHANHDRLWHS